MREHDIMRKRLLMSAGVMAIEAVVYDIESLRKSEWSPEFERLMRNRLVMGSFRYQKFEDKRKSFDYDTAGEAIIIAKNHKTTIESGAWPGCVAVEMNTQKHGVIAFA